MTRIFNRHIDKEKRQYLRNHAPKAECILWTHLRRRQIEGIKFRRQYGVERFVIDFYSPEIRLAIEIDGPTHLGPEAKDCDDYRQQFIESLDIQFLRFTNQAVYERLDAVLDVIREKAIALKQSPTP